MNDGRELKPNQFGVAHLLIAMLVVGLLASVSAPLLRRLLEDRPHIVVSGALAAFVAGLLAIAVGFIQRGKRGRALGMLLLAAGPTRRVRTESSAALSALTPIVWWAVKWLCAVVAVMFFATFVQVAFQVGTGSSGHLFVAAAIGYMTGMQLLWSYWTYGRRSVEWRADGMLLGGWREIRWPAVLRYRVDRELGMLHLYILEDTRRFVVSVPVDPGRAEQLDELLAERMDRSRAVARETVEERTASSGQWRFAATSGSWW